MEYCLSNGLELLSASLVLAEFTCLCTLIRDVLCGQQRISAQTGRGTGDVILCQCSYGTESDKEYDGQE